MAISSSSLLASLVVSVTLLQVLVAGAPAPLAVYPPKHSINKEILNPTDSSSEQIDDEVEELHKLDWSAGNHGGANTTPLVSVQPMENQPSSNKGINYKNVETADKGDGKRNGQPEKSSLINEITSNRDTPRDMAEYIFWTGDERGVTAAIKDFVDQGLMSQVEGLTFLEEVRYDLHQMKLRFGDGVEAMVLTADANEKALPSKTQHYTTVDDDIDEQVELGEPVVEIQTAPPKVVSTSAPSADNKVEQQHVQQHVIDHEKPHGEIVVSSFDPKKVEQIKPVDTITDTETELVEEIKSKPVETDKDGNDDGEEHQLAELINNEYSLEEIIYQLARILFSQSLHQVGNPEAEEALKKFADFLEKESQNGKMSPQLQKKVLDVLLMSLFDAMGDHQNPSFSVSKLAADLEKTSNLPEKH